MARDEAMLDFAEDVRIRAGKIAAAALAGRNQKAAALALELCTDATNLRQRHLMADEAGDAGRFDLAGLAGLPMAGPELRE